MKIVSVLNYKGGVGKTTLTSNIGAELARRGRKVLLLDLDPQSNLTFCYYTPDEWRKQLRDRHTIKQWFDSFRNGKPTKSLADIITKPAVVNAVFGEGKGSLDFIGSHLRLLSVDLDLATDLRGTNEDMKAEIHEVREALRFALANDPIPRYDYVLIDCPPSFNILTQSGLIASDYVLVPTRADYLSTIGVEFLYGAMHDLVSLHNRSTKKAKIAPPEIMGVVFTMVEFYNQHPIMTQQEYMNRVKRLNLPVFTNVMRHNTTLFGNPIPTSMPAVLKHRLNSQISIELMALVSEFENAFKTERALAA
ncbi:ParA family protein [Catelliglobosispora koreensis]|uniref:ParA family protein n=1 Tax=Catelliglobosispora koreensis TaxID=129052 RepID=UPI00036ABD62|nr:AAA family ATPase [Catelliglobosispora koreensis]